MESLPAVLIVDDDRVVLRTMQDQLSRENYRVAAISSVAEAVQRLRIERFGIIMADQFMPETPVLEFLRICRETQPLSSRMIITGMASTADIEEAIVRGDAFRVLIKPWTRFDLRLALTQATDRYRLMEQLEAAIRETRRQRSDLGALGRQLESYRQQFHSGPAPGQLGDSVSETEEIFRQVICHVDQAVWISDAESNRILYLSPVHEQIWGRPLKDLYENDRSWIETIHPDDRQRLLKAALEDENDGNYDEQYRILRPDGEVRWIRDRAFPIRNSQKKLYRIVGIAEDITGRKIASEQLEMRVRERTEELAWANLALESEISERRRAEIQLRKANQRLQKALEELHATQQFYRQRDETEIFDSVDLLEALTEAISMTQPRWRDEALAQGRHIMVEQEFQPVPMIACHGGEIREVVTNLIFNAVDALPQGGKIVLRAYSREQNAVFEVSDDGVGMTEEVRARCLEPFVTTKGERGTGLGLAVVYGIVQRHHGTIEIESKLGDGSLVRVSLPFYQG
jgi:PAS domain S-box-containing protein